MSLEIKIKSRSKLNKLVVVEEDFDGTEVTHIRGVGITEETLDMIAGTDSSINRIEMYSHQGRNYIAFKLDDIWVNSSMIETLTDKEKDITIPIKATISSSNYKNSMLLVGDYYINTSLLTIIPKEEVSICSNCGNITDELIDDKLCKKCYIEKNYYENSYSYKPTPTFYGEQIRKDVDNPIWYGLELEVGFHDKLEMTTKLLESKETVYYKSDTSISIGDKGGTEIVTHPMSFSYLMKNKLSPINIYKDTKVINSPRKNGMHIHISRTAWKNDTHYGLWYFLMHKLIDVKIGGISLLEKLGGRKFTNYCTPTSTGKVHSKNNSRSRASDRGLAINERNTDTVECRFFASTVKEEELKKNVQLLDSIIKYTKYNSKKVSLRGWLSYVSKYKSKYKELSNYMKDIVLPDIGAITVTCTKPKEYTTKLSSLPFKYFNNIITIKLKNDIILKEIQQIECSSSHNLLYVYKTDGNRTSTDLKNIDEVTYTKEGPLWVE